MDILVYDDYTQINFSATDKKSFPKSDYKLVLLGGTEIRLVESTTSIVSEKITDIDSVDSITDSRTGGAGVVAVPATISLLFDTLIPYWYSVGNTTLGAISVNVDDLEKGVWDKIAGNSKEFNLHVGVHANNPSGSVDNMDTIVYKTGVTTIVTQTFVWDALDNVVSITAS